MTYKYLASPYMDKDPAIMLERFTAAQNCLAWLLKHKIWTYSPIVHYHQLALDYDLPPDHEFWLDYDRAMILSSDGVYVLCISGCKESRGVTGEIEFAKTKNLSITYVWPVHGNGYLLSP